MHVDEFIFSKVAPAAETPNHFVRVRIEGDEIAIERAQSSDSPDSGPFFETDAPRDTLKHHFQL